jgi:5-methylcytosine-specific restriction endonuclease McrA
MWLRLSDRAADDPRIICVARNRGEADRYLGMLVALMLYAASQGTDGFLPELIVREHVRSRRLLELFCAPPDGPGALLHTRDDTGCECLAGRDWKPGMAYYLHHYLQWNPTKDEYDVKKAQEAELRDGELRAAVRRRDRDRCRYCGKACRSFYARRGGDGLVLDHVDPRLAEGAANLVVACRACNSRKNRRTPEAAGMVLLPPPVDDDPPAEVAGRPEPPDWDPYDPSTPTPAPTSGSTGRSTTGATSGSAHSRARDGTGRDGTGRPPDPAPAAARAEPGDAGPAGIRPATGPPVGPPRSSATPNPYHRRAITGGQPEHHAGLPEDDP